MKKVIITLLCLLWYSAIAMPQWTSSHIDAQDKKVALFLDKLLVEGFEPSILNSVDQAANTLSLEAPFAIGSGNAHSMSTSSYPSVKLGVGIGVSIFTINPNALLNSVVHNIDQFTSNLSSLDSTSITNVPDDFFSLFANTLTDVPIPYYSFYFKIGLPEASQFLSDFPMDIGFRIGFIPNAGALLPSSLGIGSYTFKTGGFNIGVEARMQLLKASIFYTDIRLSADFSWREIAVGSKVNLPDEVTNGSSGLVDKNGVPVFLGGAYASVYGEYSYRSSLRPSMSYTWSGFVFSPRLFMGIDIPVIGGLYFGAGPDVNFGSVDISMNVNIDYTTSVSNLRPNTGTFPPGFDLTPYQGTREGSLKTTSGVKRTAFNAYDFRLIAGIQFFFMNFSLEYGVVSKHFAVTFYPFAIKF